MLQQVWTAIGSTSGEILAGLVGGAVAAGLTGLGRYYIGWYRAGQFRGADFHIAATFYTPLDAQNPAHARYSAAIAAGKTHVQELIWLGEEIALSEFLENPYVLHEVSEAMGRAKDAGLLLDDLPERASRPLLKKILGYHNRIPATDLVALYKSSVGTASDGRVHGIAPPTHESYAGSPHRRVLRAMFIAQSQLTDGLPPMEAVHFPQEAHKHRYRTLQTLIADYRANPDKFANCRAFF